MPLMISEGLFVGKLSDADKHGQEAIRLLVTVKLD